MKPTIEDLSHKIIVITGANSGIGKAAAVALAKQGAQIVMLCRNKEKGEAARKDIIAASNNASVDLMIADVTNPASVSAFAVDFKSKYSRLDVLLNNAGGIFHERHTTPEGWEYTFALNHLGYFLVTHYLLESLRNAPKARIVNVSSEAHRFVMKVPTEKDWQAERYHMWHVYGLSKLANIYFTKSLAKRLESEHITVNCLHPGVVRTNFGMVDGGVISSVGKYLQFMMITPEKGAETSVYLASSPEVEKVTGQYFSKCRQRRPSPLARNEAAAEKLWQDTLRFTGITEFGTVNAILV